MSERRRFLSDSRPAVIEKNPHLVVSLLFLDFQPPGPTKVAMEHFLPRMPRGSVIAFDELDHPIWPGETLALAETLGINRLKLDRIELGPVHRVRRRGMGPALTGRLPRNGEW